MTAPRRVPPPAAVPGLSEAEMRFFLDDPIPDDELPFELHWTNFRLSALPSYTNGGELKLWWPPHQPIPWHHPELGTRRGGNLYDPEYARERWRLAECEVLRWWTRNRPGSRPSRWWLWSAPEPRPRGEGQLKYLRRHGLLERAEQELLAAAVHS